MELMVSRRMWIGLIAGFALGLVLASLFVPWSGLLFQSMHSPMYSHHNSPIASDNKRDMSYLTDEVAEDRTIWACHFSENSKQSAGRAWDNGFVVQSVHDPNGAGGGCGQDFTGTNAAKHDSCNGHNPIEGCGPKSDHGT
jgi:hypothetical protein